MTNEDPFSDVTLVSGDELLDYQVHKFVLSAVSPVFKEILLNNPHDHPLIYLSNVRERELQLLLQLIYFGRTTAYDSQVDAFLKVLSDYKHILVQLGVICEYFLIMLFLIVFLVGKKKNNKSHLLGKAF